MSSEERADLEFTRLSTAHLNDAMKIEAEAYPDPWTRTMFLQEIEGLPFLFLRGLRWPRTGRLRWILAGPG